MNKTSKNRFEFILFYIVFIILFFSGCKTKYVTVPVETVKTEKEYINLWHRDSIHVHDSIFLAKKGDTILIEKYKTVYKDRMVKDSIIITDSIKVEIPYPIEIEKEVNRLNSFQSFQIWCGRILLLITMGLFSYKFIRKKFFT